MSAVAVADVPRGKPARAPRPVAVLEDVLLELVDIGDNIRDDAGGLDELAASIVELGVQQPVKVTRQSDGRYHLVFGQRRVLASRQAGLKRIPAIVEPPSDLDRVGARRSIEQLAENLQRKDLNAIEEAVALREVLDADPALTQAELARRLGMSAPWVSNTLRLLDTAPKVRELVRSGALSAAHAKVLAGLPTTAALELADRAVKSELSAHDLESAAKWERERIGEREKSRKASAAAGVSAVAALASAGVEPGTPVWVSSGWQVDSRAVAKAIEAAGYTLGSGFVGYGDRWSGCDCTAVRVNVAAGSGTTVTPTCADPAHSDAREAERRRQHDEKLAQAARETEAIKAAVKARLVEAPPHPAVVRLLLRTLDGYSGDAWTEYAKKSDASALDELANRISTRHGTTYGKPLAAKAVLEALGAAEVAPPAKRTRKAVA